MTWTVLPVTLQVPLALALNETGRPDDAVAETPKSGAVYGRSASGPNVIVWLSRLTGAFGRAHAEAPRPRGQAESAVAPRSICRSQIIALGRPAVNFCQIGETAFTLFVK